MDDMSSTNELPYKPSTQVDSTAVAHSLFPVNGMYPATVEPPQLVGPPAPSHFLSPCQNLGEPEGAKSG